MRHLLLSTALVLSVSACKDPDGDDPTERLVDPFEFVTSRCEELVLDDGRVCDDFEGASSYGVAELTFNEDQSLSGTYFWTLVGNESWKRTKDWTDSRAGENGDPYCTLALALTGTWSDDSEICGACDKGITYNTAFDASQTTCPDAFVNAERDRLSGKEGATWGLEVDGDGSARGWDTNGEWADNGEADDKGAVLWGYIGCSWFGADECT
jgi:hypothetical protein